MDWSTRDLSAFLTAVLTALMATVSLYTLYTFWVREGDRRTRKETLTGVEAGNLTMSFPASAGPEDRQYLLLKEYHAQGLAQSRTSFWFSLISASIGFLVILTGLLNVQYGEEFSKQSASFVPILSGTVIDTVSALFFVQSNRARKLMSDFFDKLRTDRKLDESLRLLEQIENTQLKSRVQVLLALQFSDVPANDSFLTALLGLPGDLHKGSQSAQETSKQPAASQGEKTPGEAKPEIVLRSVKTDPPLS